MRLIIEMNEETGQVKVGHTDSKIHCDYMLAEAKRILDRLHNEKHYAARGLAPPGARIAVPSGTLDLGGNHG